MWRSVGRTRRTTAPMRRLATPHREATGGRRRRAPEPFAVHPDPLRGVLALAEGRGAVHRGPSRRGCLPDRGGARASRQHFQLDRRALLASARLRGLPRAAGGGARRVPSHARSPAVHGPSETLRAAVLTRSERVRDGPGGGPSERRGDRAQGVPPGGGCPDRGDRERGEGARGGHRPDGVLRKLPAPSA